MPLVDKLSSRFLENLNDATDSSTYYQVASESLCSIGLWVFAEEQSVPKSKLGKVVLSTLVFPPAGDDKVGVFSGGGKATVENLSVTKLTSTS